MQNRKKVLKENKNQNLIHAKVAGFRFCHQLLSKLSRVRANRNKKDNFCTTFFILNFFKFMEI